MINSQIPQRAGPAPRGALPVYDSDRSRFSAWKDDLLEGLRTAPIWGQLSVMDTSSEHRRFLLGTLWVPLGMIIFVFALGYVYSYLRNTEFTQFTTYLAASMVGWVFMSSSVTQGMSVFVSARRYIENIRLPLHYHVFKTVSDIALIAVLTIPTYLLCLVLFPSEVSVSALLWLPPALLLFLLSSYGMVVCIGLLNLRLRDIQAPIQNFMRLMFLITPVIWMLESTTGSRRAVFVTYNPFFHYLEIFRAPLLGYRADPQNWIVALSCTAALLLLATASMLLFQRRIHFWV
ncbi:MAG: ABC transporter permease [Litorimonas sp.]